MVNSNSQKEFWEQFSSVYSQYELINNQSAYTCFTLSNAQKPGARVLEVACASGVGTEIVAMSILNKQESPVLVAIDFAPSFVQMTKQRFDQSDFKLIPGYKAHIDTDNDYTSNGQKVNLDEAVAAQGDFKKLVLGFQGSGTYLPFPDEWFTSYVSNLCLMLVDDQTSMIREAFRVLKPGSIAAFTVWGRREYSLTFEAPNIARKRLREAKGEPDPAPDNSPSNFDVGRDIDHWLTVFKQAGFAQVKRWFQPINQAWRNGEDFAKNAPTMGPIKDQEVISEIKKVYDELSGSDSPDLKVFETIVILAWKD